MNIVYNSDMYYVIEYSQNRGFEVVNKSLRRGTFFEGAVAEKFCASMNGAIGEDPSCEHLDEFLEGFGNSIDFSTTVH